MAIVDFKEIPKAHIADGNQDTFELFCQEFLKFQGLEIISSPDRGADGGADLLCVENRTGGFGITRITWLVSCKHKAHSGNSVTPTDEQNISDRLIQHKADGFIGFYSTLPSAGLNNRLESYKSSYEIKVFNYEEIEEKLLESPKGHSLFKRFFEKSYENWKRNNIKPAILYSSYEPLKCSYCGLDILSEKVEEERGALIGMVRDYKYTREHEYHKEKFVDIYFACKGICDDMLEKKYGNMGFITDWKDIGDLKIPIEYVRWVMAFLNNYQTGSIEVEDIAFEKLKKAIMCLSQYTMRDLSDEELKREETLNMLPEWLR